MSLNLKIFILILSTFLIDITATATTYNLDPVPLSPGNLVKVDVAKYPKFVPLRVVAPKYEKPISPTVEIKNENGFECILFDAYLSGYEMDYDLETNKEYFIGTWEILILWSPGADLSGCSVRVSLPDQAESSAYLYMNE
jgi:hypothetical protein